MDLMFFGVTAGGMPFATATKPARTDPNSSGGCLMSIDVTAGDGVTDAFPTGLAASLGEPGGTSGIVIDNVISSPLRLERIFHSAHGGNDQRRLHRRAGLRCEGNPEWSKLTLDE